MIADYLNLDLTLGVLKDNFEYWYYYFTYEINRYSNIKQYLLIRHNLYY